jgi:hypothetical protein
VREANDKTIEELTLKAAECFKEAAWHEARGASAAEQLQGWANKANAEMATAQAFRKEAGRCIEEIRKGGG